MARAIQVGSSQRNRRTTPRLAAASFQRSSSEFRAPPPDAVILGALLVQGVRTGPSLFADGASIVYTFIFGLLLATVLMLPVGLMIGRFAYGAIVRAPKAALVPVVAFMTVIGTFAIRNSLSDIAIMIFLGVIGWVAGKRGFSVSPIVLGLILGRIAEQGFVQSWTIGEAIGNLWGQFFGRPLSMAIIALTLLTFFYPFLPRLKQLFSRSRAMPSQERARAPTPAIVRDLIALVIAGGIALLALQQSAGPQSRGRRLPRNDRDGDGGSCPVGASTSCRDPACNRGFR